MSEERIDYWKVLNQQCSGDEDVFWRSAYRRLRRLETMKQYPPWLSLEITRTRHAREHLRTNIAVNGVKPHLEIELAAPSNATTKTTKTTTTTTTTTTNDTTSTTNTIPSKYI